MVDPANPDLAEARQGLVPDLPAVRLPQAGLPAGRLIVQQWHPVLDTMRK